LQGQSCREFIDGRAIANGFPGSVSQNMREIFFDIAEKTAI
jgi:D-alanine transaminase